MTKLYLPPMKLDGMDRDPAAPAVGAPVAPFPRWQRCSLCDTLATVESRVFKLSQDPYRPDRTQYVHQGCLKSLGGKPPAALSVRFLIACREGHLTDFPWLEFVHKGNVPCQGAQLSLREYGASGDASDIVVHLAARRIDQALYDLIASAKHEILLVTFAAVKVDRLADSLLKAAQRGVKIRLVLEFAEASEGQLSFDALRAFSTALIDTAEVYYWPVENRERNQAGRPGKLHAKLAAIDNVVLISSANLTDDAFSRNLELGVKLTDPDVVLWAKEHFQDLIRDNTLRRLSR